jgi:4-hydroxy-tetrahydrodipicolinate reductase
MADRLLRVVVTGVSGRMGSTLVRMVREAKDLTLVGGTDQAGTASIGLDVGLAARQRPAELPTLDSLDKALDGADVVIDFTNPEASILHAKVCAERGVPLVIGSTGFSAESNTLVDLAATKIPLVVSPNMSVGVNLLIQLTGELARKIGPSFDVEIVETHHRHKKDAPSGTALRLAEEVAIALGRGHKDIRTARVGQVGERSTTEIGVQSLRGGDVVGEHTVFFLGDGERIELTHRATSRDQFGHGALRAARWIVGRRPGLYSMLDVLAEQQLD